MHLVGSISLLLTALLGCAFAQYDYVEVLQKSILFYEAEQSGALTNNRIPWRGDSALDDGSDNGLDLTGGWYDAGDHVKFGLPMAYTATVMGWGLWAFRAGYEAAGELENGQAGLRWALDYFLKCHPQADVLYAQVGDGYEDHAYWGRPEQMTMFRPSFSLDTTKPGSDLAGETAAALAAGYMVFQDDDPGYADSLLAAARSIYTFAYNNRGLYMDHIPAGDFYGSTGYEDELSWAAIWLYTATGEQEYMDQAVEFYDGGVQWAFSWDAKAAGTQVLMYQATQDQQYADHVAAFLQSWAPGGGLTYTPGGLAWRDQWGSLRYAASTAAIALLAAQQGIDDAANIAWAKTQLDYMLGTNPSGRSYVVGYGNNPPVRPHHRAASCDPDINVQCDWAQHDSPDPNPSVLEGALVGGPDQNDYYEDDRSNYIFNEVACDYNSGFQAALAGMITLEGRK